MHASRLAELVAAGMGDGGRTKALASALRSLIVDGRLLDGDRLPAERVLAEALQISRSTVTAAYDQLRVEGILVGRQGAGTFVSVPVIEGGRPDEDPQLGEAAHLDLSVAVLPAPSVLAAAVSAAAESIVVHLASIGLQPAGLPELRTLVASEYSRRGLPTTPDQILITSGALHGWDLLLRAFARPGAPVVTEQPTYPGVIDAALAHRVRLRPLPVDADGWHPEELDPARTPVLAHVTFDGQNPTGLWADRSTRNRVLSTFDSSTLVAVDETMIDFPSSPTVGAEISPLARYPTVVILGSASKSFWAGLRVGWLRGPTSMIRRLAALRAGQDLAPPILNQLVLSELLRHREEILPDRRDAIAVRRRALLDAIQQYCPKWTVVPPAGGLAAWIDLGGRSSTQLAIEAREHGVRVTPGTRFTQSGTHDGFLRLPYVLPIEQLEESVRRLAAASENLQSARPRRHPNAATAWSA
jgi:DNA-binding transcriptional MocR family regulator